MRLHDAGLVNRVVADGTALDTALSLTNDLAMLAPNVITATKPLIAGAQDQSLAEHFLAEQHRFIESLQHSNAHEGLASFLKKEAGIFQQIEKGAATKPPPIRHQSSRLTSLAGNKASI